jgi:hypothetical protein
MELTKEEEMKANAAAGTVLAGLFRGLACVCKGTGVVVENTTKYTAKGLRLSADGIEGAGQKVSGVCYDAGDACQKKSEKYAPEVETVEAEAVVEGEAE